MEADTPHVFLARDLTELDQALSVVVRKRECAQCGSSSQLECPKCPRGQVCQYFVPTDCTQCPQAVCTDDSPQPASGSKGSGGGGPSAGPIAGGVVGGVIVIVALTYLVWRFLIKPKRSNMSQSMYEPNAKASRGVEKDSASRMTRRSSMHTVHSIASTILTRASNIIQIAYIPGVTNRATPTSPTVLMPPVPPIPMQHTGPDRSPNQADQHLVLGNLRDSTYSGISEFSDRTSYAPRSSIASTIYGKQAQVQSPAQTGMRAKPTVVSVKSGSGGGPNTPPVPSIDFERFGSGRPKSGASAFSVGSMFLNNANTATQARAQVVKLGAGPKKIDVGAKSESSTSLTSLVSVSSPDSVVDTPTRDSGAVTVTDDSPVRDQGPFSDPPAAQKPAATRTLGAVIEGEEIRPEDEAPRRPKSSERGRSPFDDEHSTRE